MGRTSLLMIIVFNITFMMMGFRLSSATTAAYEKYIGYADIEQAGLAMESCANIAISNALLDTSRSSVIPIWSGQTIFGKTGSSFTITQYPIFDGVAQIGESLRVIGSYPINIKGSIDAIQCTTSVRVRGNAFAQYVFYSQTESAIQWQTGETCWGRLHTQDNLTVNGTPTFKGRVTTKGKVVLSPKSSKPNFEQGQGFADISIPTELTEVNKYGAIGGAYYQGVNTYVEFKSDGHVIVRAATTATLPQDAWGYSSATTGTVSDGSGGPAVPKFREFNSVAALTSSGVLLVKDAQLHVKGVLDGKITLGCVESTTTGTKSSVWIDSSLTYLAAPPSFKNPTNVSDDMLGIVATNDIMVSRYINSRTVSPQVALNNVTIHGSLFSQRGGFGAQNYDTRASGGTLRIVGGIQQKDRHAVGVNNGATGFLKDYDWDQNLLTSQPVGYPRTPFVIQNWVDNTNIPVGFWE